MSEHVSVCCHGERDDRKGVVHMRTSWRRWLLVCTAVAITICGPLPSKAGNGEPVVGQGLFRTGACTSDFTISCDDRPEAGVVSCHMRSLAIAPALAVDEGLAIDHCPDSRIVSGGTLATFLEKKVAVDATDFGAYVCGKEPGISGMVDFCVVCDTFKDPAASIGASHCVKIVHDNPTAPIPDGTCGAFNVSTDASGLCLSAEQDLQQNFSDPHVGFTIGFDASDAGKPGAGVGQEGGKDLLVCGGRSWQCIDDRSEELSLDAEQLGQQQNYGLINTPCCITSGGTRSCNPLWPKSTLCR